MGHSSGDTVQHSGEGVAAGQWAAAHVVSQSGSRDVGVGAPPLFPVYSGWDASSSEGGTSDLDTRLGHAQRFVSMLILSLY